MLSSDHGNNEKNDKYARSIDIGKMDKKCNVVALLYYSLCVESRCNEVR